MSRIIDPVKRFLNKKTGRLAAVIIVLAISAVLFLTVLRPWYVNYIKQDHIETCDKSRYNIIFAMQRAKHKAADEGRTDFTEEEALDAVNELLSTDFGVTITAFGEPVPGICREGGTWTILYDETTGNVSTFCTAEGHEEDSDWSGMPPK